MGVYDINGNEISKATDYSYLKDKAYYAIGDSIVEISGTKASPVTLGGQVLYGYTQAIEDRYGLICSNLGQGGHTITQDYSMLYAMDYSNVSLVTIGYGVNDGRTNVPLGERDSLDTTTFAGALGSLIKKIYTDNKECRILVLTPIQRNYVNNWGSYTQNNNGDTLEDFAEMCKSVANYYGTPCVDLFHNSGLNEANLTSLTAEGVHPLNRGFNRMANAIIPFTDDLFNISQNFW